MIVQALLVAGDYTPQGEDTSSLRAESQHSPHAWEPERSCGPSVGQPGKVIC